MLTLDKGNNSFNSFSVFNESKDKTSDFCRTSLVIEIFQNEPTKSQVTLISRSIKEIAGDIPSELFFFFFNDLSLTDMQSLTTVCKRFAIETIAVARKREHQYFEKFITIIPSSNQRLSLMCGYHEKLWVSSTLTEIKIQNDTIRKIISYELQALTYLQLVAIKKRALKENFPKNLISMIDIILLERDLDYALNLPNRDDYFRYQIIYRFKALSAKISKIEDLETAIKLAEKLDERHRDNIFEPICEKILAIKNRFWALKYADMLPIGFYSDKGYTRETIRNTILMPISS